jgi:hypothetical protein
MDKRDIYEHLAKIYLDASTNSKRNSRARDYSRVFRSLFFVSVFLVAGLSAGLLFTNYGKTKSPGSQVELVLLPEAARINFHFDPAKKEIYTLNLNKLDLNRYRALAFCVKKAKFRDKISLRVEFASGYGERSEVYFKDIPHKWQDYKVNLSQFRGISDWSQMRCVAFIVEEWNASEKRGIVYIDNVRLVK